MAIRQGRVSRMVDATTFPQQEKYPRRKAEANKRFFEAEAEYFEYLKDKSVVIVGPAGYLKGQGRGPEFDGYDVIVRINLSCPVAEDLKVDVGSRTDVLYHIIIKDTHIKQRPDLFQHHTREELETWAADGVKYVITRDNNRVNGFMPLTEGLFTAYPISSYQMRLIRNMFRTMPNMGSMAIWHILKSDCKSLHVAGCDYHLTGYYETYGGFDEKQAAAGKRGDAGMKRCWGQIEAPSSRMMHFVPHQLRALSRIKQRDKRLTCDQELAVQLE